MGTGKHFLVEYSPVFKEMILDYFQKDIISVIIEGYCTLSARIGIEVNNYSLMAYMKFTTKSPDF